MENDELTERELLVLKEIINGKSNPQIAKDLYISLSTVKAHVGSILQKLGVSNRVEAAVKGFCLLFTKNLGDNIQVYKENQFNCHHEIVSGAIKLLGSETISITANDK